MTLNRCVVRNNSVAYYGGLTVAGSATLVTPACGRALLAFCIAFRANCHSVLSGFPFSATRVLQA